MWIIEKRYFSNKTKQMPQLICLKEQRGDRVPPCAEGELLRGERGLHPIRPRVRWRPAVCSLFYTPTPGSFLAKRGLAQTYRHYTSLRYTQSGTICLCEQGTIRGLGTCWAKNHVALGLKSNIQKGKWYRLQVGISLSLWHLCNSARRGSGQGKFRGNPLNFRI